MQSIKIYTIIILAAAIWGCKKQEEWLDERYDKSDVVPETLADFQGLLDNNTYMNAGYCNLGTLGADNYYVLDADLATLSPTERNSYKWAKDIFEGGSGSDWGASYNVILYANVVLDGLAKIGVNPANVGDFNQIKGSALFYRAQGYYNLVQAFTKPYSATAAQDLGLPIKLSSDVNETVTRSTLSQTYEQMLTDLKAAEALLPATGFKLTRPSRSAAQGLLARIYQDMADFSNAELYATKALAMRDTLLDFNGITVSGTLPFSSFTRNHPEILLYATSGNFNVFVPFTKSLVDSILYNSYTVGDIRRDAFFRIVTSPVKKIFFKGSYGAASMFSGIAINELYLIKAESMVRNNKVQQGLSVLNALLKKRFKPLNYVQKSANSIPEALAIVLEERRKELPFTGQLRWSDLRRLNQDPALAKTLIRKVGGTEITLPPNDPKYVLPIPDAEIRINGLQQNPR